MFTTSCYHFVGDIGRCKREEFKCFKVIRKDKVGFDMPGIDKVWILEGLIANTSVVHHPLIPKNGNHVL